MIQRKALAALQRSRAAGNTVGLVVLATGLGKTWLSAFDTMQPAYKRVLFVAHREEILDQACETFRKARPNAQLGLYTGRTKAPDADVVFASIQTLGRQNHLLRFAPEAFDYIVVDEFHHAAANTYRRLLNHFTPKFLLGLTATPERTDGGDLLALCQENLVYSCGIHEGISHKLLCPFHYFGVPDDVDYRNIPWREVRFDEADLTAAVATESRARNILDEYRKRAGLAHWPFVARSTTQISWPIFFGSRVCAVAVHSGPASARAASLEQLNAGSLDIVCAVDMFNEGIDLPLVDTVLMLRPTESRIVWLQQLGRGLRTATGKTHLTVIDYIGNHRAFLLNVSALSNCDRSVPNLQRPLSEFSWIAPICRRAARSLTICKWWMSFGVYCCRSDSTADIDLYYGDFKERTGCRPLAAEAFHEGYNPRMVRKSAGSWVAFVDSKCDLNTKQKLLRLHHHAFLNILEITPMTRSFKMLTLLAMLNRDSLPGSIEIGDLAREFSRLAGRSAALRADVGVSLDDHGQLRKYLERNPVAAWAGRKRNGRNCLLYLRTRNFSFHL